MRRALVIVFISVFAIGVVACSDDDSGSDAQDVSGVESDDNDNDSSSSDAPSGDPEEFCARVVAANDAGATDPSSDGIDDDQALADAIAEIESLREVAPNQEIDDALGTYADLFTRIAELDLPTDADLGNSEDPFGDAIAGPYMEMLEIMFDPEFLEASVTLGSYFTDECGVDFGLGELGGIGDPTTMFDGLGTSLEDFGLEDLSLEDLENALQG